MSGSDAVRDERAVRVVPTADTGGWDFPDGPFITSPEYASYLLGEPMNEQVGIAGYTEQMVYTSASGLEATHLHLRSWEELNDLALKAPSGARILQEIFDIAQTLLEKNISYGNSALEPARIFSQADPREQILVRIDDKLTRIKNSKEYPGDDTVLDLIGYLVLLRVS